MNRSQFSSPTNDRFKKISEKLGSIQLNQENSKAHRIDIFDQRVRTIEEKYIDAVQFYNKRIQQLREDVVKLQKTVEEDRKSFSYQVDARNQELLNADSKISTKLETEINQRKDSEFKLHRHLEEKISFLKTDVATETKIRIESIDGLTSTLESDLPKLQELVKNEQEEREQEDEVIIRKTADEIKKLNSVLVSQKKSREDSENAIFEMLKDLVGKVKDEIDEERKEREESQETLLAVLEDTCNKLCQTASN